MLAMVGSHAELKLLHIGNDAPELTDENGAPLNMPIMVREGGVVEMILATAGMLKPTYRHADRRTPRADRRGARLHHGAASSRTPAGRCWRCRSAEAARARKRNCQPPRL